MCFKYIFKLPFLTCLLVIKIIVFLNRITKIKRLLQEKKDNAVGVDNSTSEYMNSMRLPSFIVPNWPTVVLLN